MAMAREAVRRYAIDPCAPGDLIKYKTAGGQEKAWSKNANEKEASMMPFGPELLAVLKSRKYKRTRIC